MLIISYTIYLASNEYITYILYIYIIYLSSVSKSEYNYNTYLYNRFILIYTNNQNEEIW